MDVGDTVLLDGDAELPELGDSLVGDAEGATDRRHPVGTFGIF